MDQLRELVGFLETPAPQVHKIALENLLPYTASRQNKQYLFTNEDLRGVKAIRNILLSTADSDLRKMALSALINLSDDEKVRSYLASTPSDLSHYVTKVTSKTEPHAGLYAMLLANLSHDRGILSLVGPNLDLLIFAIISNAPMTSFDYLGFLFGEVARTKQGAKYLVDGNKLEKLYGQLHSPSLTRRSGIAAAVKNVLFNLKTHAQLVKTSAIEQIMIALKGPEELDAEDTAKLPDSVRTMISPQKKREPDAGMQLVLMECLLLLSSSPEGREALREKQAYFIVREFHLATDDGDLKQLCERFVNQVMRGEPEEPKIREIVDSDEEDDEIVEVA